MKLTAMRSHWNKLRAGWRDQVTAILEKRSSLKKITLCLKRTKQIWLGLPRLHRRLLMVLGPVVLVLTLLPSPSPTAPSPQVRQPVAINADSNLPTSSDEAPPSATTSTSSEAESTAGKSPWISHQIESGDTLAKVFRDYDLALTDLYSIANIEGEGKPISRIQPGQWIRFKRKSNGALDILQIETEKGQSVLYFRLSDGSFARQR
ncbi:LysM-like peptidoglycan-binding domain-containing protein [Salinivibrio sp. ES.052]|uniref:LysM-like peptidoglycan-binding domain-containing protein n=1 Tax=Salinivibrio sp. ES.052 TaxID=1882823 RepID=UPI00092A74A3|nr:LysM-like peptidoglycan-binding domain-containing protein [Salinivibrio sp. ES.052]SIO26745.1 hypothetical protein SAMN05444724_2514 [Salinivibrio sp. ES.052]